MGISDILNVSKQGVFASQSALKVVSHNITNVNTAGFSRQTVSMTSSAQLNTPGNRVGGEGVYIDQVEQAFDELVDNRILGGQQELGRLESRNRFMSMIENVFNDLDGDGFSQRMESFFASVDDLANSPVNPVAREQVASDAQALARFANKMYDDLSELTMPVDQEITNTLEDLNAQLENIRDLNDAIIRQDNGGQQALDLMDQRRIMIEELASVIDIQTTQTSDGGVTIHTGDGDLLLDHNFAGTFQRGPVNTETGFMSIMVNGDTNDYTGKVLSGELKGMLEVRDELINGQEGFLTRLEGLVDEIRYEFNKIHSQSVSQDMYTSLTGGFDLGSDLTTSMSSLITDPTDPDYNLDFPPPPDLSKALEDIQGFFDSQGNLIDPNNTPQFTLAYGPDALNLQPFSVDVVDPNTGQVRSVQGLVDAINSAEGNNGNITASVVDNRIQLAASGSSSVMGVAEDNSGMMAALGVNAMFHGDNARNIQVDQRLLDDDAHLGIVKIELDGNGGASFDNAGNGGMIEMGSYRSKDIEHAGEYQNFAEHFATIIGNLGSDIRRNSEALQAQQSAQDFTQEVRSSISGVSLEEELTDLIKYQRSFQASSKMVSVADSLMEMLLTMV